MMRFCKSRRGVNQRKRTGARSLPALLAAMALASVEPAFADMLTVTSTNDAHGLFTYTFSRGSDPYVWGLSTNGDAIYMQFYGVSELIPPPNWTASIDSSGRIVWSVTNDLVYLDSPVTFSVRSIFSTARLYNAAPSAPSAFSQGLVIGDAYQRPNPESFGLGYEYLDMVGPDPTALTIKKVNNSVVLGWYVGLNNFQLEANTNLLSPTGWQAVTNNPVVVGNQWVVTNSATAGSRFYRLRLN